MSVSSTDALASPYPISPFPASPDPRAAGPIRAEMLGLERLDALARALAEASTLLPPNRRGSPLLKRFEENGRLLVAAHARIVAHDDPREGRGTDAEWLADNFHIVDEVLREVRHDLPPGYDGELPKLAASPLTGYPRVYAMAAALVAHTDSEQDEARITRFVQAFQEVAPLTIGELWALPTMLRLVLIENLRRLAEQMIWGWDERLRAEAFAAEVMAIGASAGGGRLAPPLPSPSDPSDPFVVRVMQLLRDQGPSSALDRLEADLGSRGVDPNETLRREHHRQAANQVSVGNCVISLRLLSALDWNKFFDRVSRVEAILRDDPSGVYPLQDFATRDRQRRAVEQVARRSGCDEEAVARYAVAMSRDGASLGPARGHIGFYLVDRGLAALKAKFGYRPRWREAILEGTLAHPRAVYFGSIVALLAALMAAVSIAGLGAHVKTWWIVPALAALLLPMSELAVGLVNHLITLFLPPRVLAKLECKDGLPTDCPTIVVMPSMLVRPKSAEVLLERLEIHYLANPDPGLRFALLTDFADAPEEHRPEDEGFLHDALARVEALNARHAADGPAKFFLFHRSRQWNPIQGTWMGWERKRGKLSEFNRLIRGAADTSYSTLSDDPAPLRDVRFVITLDADTQMPRDTARRLVGTIAHPLNRPRFDAKVGRVVEGHGVLQPRVSFHLSAASHSRFAALLASSGGIDPYSSAASDTYMDLFGIGSFTGKGIYDVDAFEAATGRAFPENQILSHDLIEGNYARCGLLSDTELFDDFPARYHAYARREHRWVRGDWQLLPWLRPTVPSADGPRPNTLPTLERWKLLDNLRRSLVPPSLVVLLALGWAVLPGSPWAWTIAALAVPAVPLIQLVLGSLIVAFRCRSIACFRRWRDSMPATLGQVAMAIAFLANQARTLVDAIARTLARVFVTHKNMLEWETAASTERRLGAGLVNFIFNMWPAPALSAALAAAVAIARPSALPAAAPVLSAWFLSPLIAFWVSRPRRSDEERLTFLEIPYLRSVARKTWHFFETFVGDEDHWLPPDNHQEEPDGRVAHRTSPTNQGLLLLSTLAAHDLGYIGARTLVDRLEKTFDTFDRMERHWGHFYNWFETRTLQPLPPAYISTVDSGNLLGCLVTLRRGLFEMADEGFLPDRLREGLSDTLSIFAAGIVDEAGPGKAVMIEGGAALSRACGKIRGELSSSKLDDLLAWDQWLGGLDWLAIGLIGQVKSVEDASSGTLDSLETWARRFSAEVAQHRADLDAIAPWLAPLRDFEAQAAPAFSGDDAEQWAAARAVLVNPLSLSSFVAGAEALRSSIASLSATAPGLARVAEAIPTSCAPALLDRLKRLAERADVYSSEMDFRPLYKPDRNLYTIGVNLTQNRLDGPCYDLLASESCLTSFLTVARGDAPRKHWFMLGRPFIRAAGETGLVSWGGTMFEYLMPRLMIKAMPGTLVAEAVETAVARQIEFGAENGVPWGISESAFNAQYVDGDYQYQSFGVPGLGLKRGLEKDLVIAPYATLLATMIAPREAVANLIRIEAEGGSGPYGFYEAIDFTPDRLPKGKKFVVVKQYMAHHQGMALVALANTLLDEPMPRRFHAEPMVKAADLLLQERIPRDVPLAEPSDVPSSGAGQESKSTPLMSRRLTTPSTPAPRTHLLSNSQYHVMLTNSGAGRSTCHGRDVTRWREDATLDNWGQFIYLRDASGSATWSAGFQPTCKVPDSYEVLFASDKATFRRRDGAIETALEVTVSPEALAEVRRVTLTNHDVKPREVEVTSYAEIVLLAHGADLAHPAFGKLFVETEWVAGSGALICRRRPRSADQPPAWAVHVVASDASAVGEPQFETDRARFLGRGRSTNDPAAMDPGAGLSGTVGPVLDPIVSLRRRVKIAPGTSAVVAFTTAVVESREDALALADQYREPSAAARAFEVSWAHGQVEHRQRNLSPEAAHQFQRLASHIIFCGTALRAAPATILANRQPLTGLWRHGISGDLPIVLLRIDDKEQLTLAREALLAHAYLRLKGLEFDLVLWNEEPSSYVHELNEALANLVRDLAPSELVDKPGGIFLRKASVVADEDRTLLQAVARVVLEGDRGPLAGQLDRIERSPALPPPLVPSREADPNPQLDLSTPPDLLFFNGLGGFTPDGREYVVAVRSQSPRATYRNGKTQVASTPHAALPPAPWSNVLANPAFGCLVSESGLGPSWAVNSQSNRLTPWNNDPVSDPPSGAVYLRDEATGQVWSATPRPTPSRSTTIVRHGQGYTVWEKNTWGLAHELTVSVDADDPIKLLCLKVRNLGKSPRRISVTHYAEWVLGTSRDVSAMHVVTEVDSETGALIARNATRDDFGGRVAFADVDRRPRTFTADRGEFLGRNGSTVAPLALKRTELSGRVGAAMDPCAAIQTKIEIAPGAEAQVVFLLGETANLADARRLITEYRRPGRADASLDQVRHSWNQTSDVVQVRTPDPAMDLLLNRWLIYQVLSCRLWARTAFYQSGGAYGFRDQLQDSMALSYAAPGVAREHILRAAGRQFVEGDVQHWWHPPTGRGVRTRISDDPYWLPFVAAHYARATGDHAIFEESVPYLKAPVLREGQEEDYGRPEASKNEESLYAHSLRALSRVTQIGEHGLPLMGTGDWNDGMNRVGVEGKGESIWLAQFQVAALSAFAQVAESLGKAEDASHLRSLILPIANAIDTTGWDGTWYRRAYFDDGTPLGSSSNDECQIDSIAQTWGVLSGVASGPRAVSSMDAVLERLVRREDGLILLFDPPFDLGSLQPGYIKGYVPGIRENGGQYTHAATWVPLALANMGRGDEAHALFDLLNPIRHGDSPEAIALYRSEPYVLAGDVYGRPPHVGRGGWTWYTGSAAWLYRVGLEAILGFRTEGDRILIDPCVPSSWGGFEVDFRRGETTYRISVQNRDGVCRGVLEVELDGVVLPDRAIPIAEDGREHVVRVRMGRLAAP